MQTTINRQRSLGRNRRGLSNVIVVSLSLVIIVVIVSNVVLWNYQMTQLDWDKSQENVAVSSITRLANGTLFTLQNKGSRTANLVSLWINNSTQHTRYDISLFVNSGETLSYLRTDIRLPNGEYTAKMISARGNIAVYTGA